MNSITADIATTFPYPGLRPFEPHEADIFFGRKQHVTDLMKRLKHHRFLAVVGPSGCGKSSLIRAGLIPALQAGFMASNRFQWNFAVMRPGNQPLLNLATALCDSGVFGDAESGNAPVVSQLRDDLESGSRSLAHRLAVNENAAGANLLILVDQFEELFRFERKGGGDESRTFVNLLLEATRDPEISAYVVITMRTDFLGDCPVLSGLPEAINDSQYLTPRLTREQIEAAITGPAKMFGGEVTSEVVTRILNEMGTDPDQLPLMQHLLMRMWRNALNISNPVHNRSGADFSPSQSLDAENTGHRLTLSHYNEAGGLLDSLKRHAESVFQNRLPSDVHRCLAEHMFRRLTAVASDGQLIRVSPAPSFAELCQDLGTENESALQRVVNEFRSSGRSFLMPPISEELKPETLIDVSHESLIRRWTRLREWTEDEARATEVRREATKDSAVWEQSGMKPEDASIPESRLVAALAWSEAHPNRVTPLVRSFLSECVRLRDRQRQKDRDLVEAQRQKIMIGLAALVFMTSTFLTVKFWVDANSANRELKNTNGLLTTANDQTEQANQKLSVANADIRQEEKRTASALAQQHWIQAEQKFNANKDLDNRDLASGILRLSRGFQQEPESDDPAVKFLYDVRLGAVLAQHPMMREVWYKEDYQPAAITSDGSFLLEWKETLTTSELRLWHRPTLSNGENRQSYVVKAKPPISGHLMRAELVNPSIDSSPDEPSIVAVVRSDNGPSRFCFWGAADGKVVEEFPMASANDNATTGKAPTMPAMAVSPDGRYAASWETAVGDTVWLSSTDKPAPLSIPAQIESAAFSPDGEWLAMIDRKGVLMRYRTSDVFASKNLERGKDDPYIGPNSRLMYSPNGQLLTIAKSDFGCDCQLWTFNDADPGERGQSQSERIVRRQIVLNVPPDTEVQSFDFSPDGGLLALGCRDRIVRIFELSGGKLAFPSLHAPLGVSRVTFSTDGQQLHVFTRWTMQTWVLVTQNGGPKELSMSDTTIYSVSNYDGRFLATFERRESGVELQVRDTDGTRSTKPLSVPGANDISWASLSDDGERVLICCSTEVSGKKSLECRIADVSAQKLTSINASLQGGKVHAAFSPDAGFLLTAVESVSEPTVGTTAAAVWNVQLWDAETGSRISNHAEKETIAGPVTRIVWSPTSKQAAVLYGKGEIGGAWLWQQQDGGTFERLPNELKHPDPPWHTLLTERKIVCASFSTDGRFLVTGGEDDCAYVWDAATGERLSNAFAHESNVVAITFCPEVKDALRFATSTAAERKVRIWTFPLNTASVLTDLQAAPAAIIDAAGAASQLAISPDGRLFATATGSIVRIWETGGWKAAATLNNELEIHALRFAEDSHSVVTQTRSMRDASSSMFVGNAPTSAVDQLSERTWHLKQDRRDSMITKGELQNTARLLAASDIEEDGQAIARLSPPKLTEKYDPVLSAVHELKRLWDKYHDRP